MSGKSIDLKSRDELKDFNSTKVATKVTNDNFLQLQKAKNDLISKNILHNLYVDRYLPKTTTYSAITNINSSKDSKIDDDVQLDLKSKAMEILAELYHKKERETKRKKRDTYQSASACEKISKQARLVQFL